MIYRYAKVSLLGQGKFYNEVSTISGISKSTLIRAKRRTINKLV